MECPYCKLLATHRCLDSFKEQLKDLEEMLKSPYVRDHVVERKKEVQELIDQMEKFLA